MALFENLARSLPRTGTLKIRCAACGHAVSWPRDKAFRLLGPGAAPFDIRRKLKCGRCGDGRSVRVWI